MCHYSSEGSKLGEADGYLSPLGVHSAFKDYEHQPEGVKISVECRLYFSMLYAILLCGVCNKMILPKCYADE